MTNRIQRLFSMAGTDPKYAEMKKEYIRLEKVFSKLAQQLPEDAEDNLWAFVCTSEEMNWRMLELICEKYDIEP